MVPDCVAKLDRSRLLGDIDPHSGKTTDLRMALSLVRDIIRHYDPELEQPEALKKLVAEFI